MARNDKSLSRLKDIVNRSRDSMGQLLLPAQWNLNITRHTV